MYLHFMLPENQEPQWKAHFLFFLHSLINAASLIVSNSIALYSYAISSIEAWNCITVILDLDVVSCDEKCV